MNLIDEIIDKISHYCKKNIVKYEAIVKENIALDSDFHTKIQSELTSQVVSWKWATDKMFNPFPFYFEERQYIK